MNVMDLECVRTCRLEIYFLVPERRICKSTELLIGIILPRPRCLTLLPPSSPKISKRRREAVADLVSEMVVLIKPKLPLGCILVCPF